MKFFILLALVFTMGVAKGTDYYVSTTGNNSNNGTSASTPWQTLSKVQSMFNNGSIVPGDKVMFKKGDVFTGTLLVSSIWGYSAKSGTATNPITIGTYGAGAKPIFQYPTNSTTTLVHRVTMWFVGVNHYVVDGLNFTETVNTQNDKFTAANCAFGIYLGTYGEAVCNNFNIKNVDISLCGMGMTLVGNNNIVSDCNLSNFKNLKNTNDGGVDDYGANAITIMGDDNQIIRNNISGAWAHSYDFGWNGGAFEMYNTCNRNNFMYNTIVDCEGVSEYGGQTSAGHTANDNVIAYNKIINCGSMLWFNMSGPFAMQGSNLQFYNNVVVENSLSRFSGPNTGNGNSHPLASYPATRLFGLSGTANAATVFNLKNNIFVQSTGINIIYSSDATKTAHQHNIYKMTGGSTNFTLATNEISTNAAIFANTTSSDPAQWNYVPIAGGPAIDFGTNVGISTDFAGNIVPTVPNAGILEAASGTGTALTATATAGTISCNAGSTTVTVSASGGVTPYTGTGIFTVSAGTYTYSVSDAAGTVKAVSVTIAQPPVVNLNVSSGTISVNGGTTTVTASASGGTGTLTYQLNGGIFQSSGNFTGVVAGNHTVTAKDANGCISVRTITITQPAPVNPLNATFAAGTIACNGGNTTININATGGTSPYTGTGTFTVTAGTYNYTIRDAANNTKTLTVTVSQPTSLSATVTAPNVAVTGATTTASVIASGGTAPYTYRINGGSYQSSSTFSAVAAGNHTINVRDANGCTITRSITVSVTVNPLVVTTDAGWILCNGGTTTVTITASGGVTPYTGTGTFTISAGSQNFTVRDAAGTTVAKTVSVVQPPVISASITSGTILSYNGSTTVTAVASGGTGALTYKLDNGAFVTSASFSNVKAGSHTLTVKDARGCTSAKSFTLTQPAQGAFQLQLSVKTNQTCAGNNNGTIAVNGYAGTLPYLFRRGTAGGSNAYSSNNVFSNLAPGSYTIYGKDATGTVSTINVTINSSSSPCAGKSAFTGNENDASAEKSETDVNSQPRIAVYPNPSPQAFEINWQMTGMAKTELIVTNISGQRVYHAMVGAAGRMKLGHQWKAGVYILTLVQGSEIQTRKLIKL